VPPEIPRICVCTAPPTPTVHKSLFKTLNEGEIADAGGDLTVVSFTLLEFVVTVLLLLESVTITSDCATANEDITKSSRNANFFVMGPPIFYDLFIIRKVFSMLDKNFIKL